MAQTKEGAIKIAAKKAGLTVNEYMSRIANGLKKCTICKEWKLTEEFVRDKSRHDGYVARCKSCSTALWRIKSMRSNKRIERRDGDKSQAKSRINRDVEAGLRPNPNDLYCSLCGHKGTDRRHEYHHIQGYSALHHYDVLPLCSACHHKCHPNNRVKKNEFSICQLIAK